MPIPVEDQTWKKDQAGVLEVPQKTGPDVGFADINTITKTTSLQTPPVTDQDSSYAVTEENYEDETSECHLLIKEDKKHVGTQTTVVKKDIPQYNYKCNLHNTALPICFLIIVAAAIISIAILFKWQNHQPRPQPHYASFHLKTRDYTTLEEVSYLQWVKDEGNFELLDGTYIFIPEDGVYEIKCAVQLYIPKNSTAASTTLMLERNHNGEHYAFMKKRPSLLSTPEHAIIQLSFRYKLQSNDAIFLKMNKARFVRPSMASSYLSITSLHIKNL